MQASIYHMPLKSHLIRYFRLKTSSFRYKKTRPFSRVAAVKRLPVHQP